MKVFESGPLVLRFWDAGVADVRKYFVIAGFGNAINVAYAIPRYEAAGAAAVVIEDKNFPKDSSLRVSVTS